jgi:hypothetical protein
VLTLGYAVDFVLHLLIPHHVKVNPLGEVQNGMTYTYHRTSHPTMTALSEGSYNHTLKGTPPRFMRDTNVLALRGGRSYAGLSRMKTSSEYSELKLQG